MFLEESKVRATVRNEVGVRTVFCTYHRQDNRSEEDGAHEKEDRSVLQSCVCVDW